MSTTDRCDSFKLCVVNELECTNTTQDIKFRRGDEGELVAEALVLTTATIKPRYTVYSVLSGARRRMQVIAKTADAVVNIEQDENSNPLQVARNRAVSAALFAQLGSNCVQCPRSEICTIRPELAKQAHHPEEYLE